MDFVIEISTNANLSFGFTVASFARAAIQVDLN